MEVRERVCFDTSFLAQLLRGNRDAVVVWKDVADLKVEVVIPVMVLFEIKRLSLKAERLEREKYEKLEKVLVEVAEIVNLDAELALKAAVVSHGTGLAARDAIIYTTARETGCSRLYTADDDFKVVAKNRDVRITMIV